MTKEELKKAIEQNNLGYIRHNKNGTFVAEPDMKYLGTFKTKNEAREILNEYHAKKIMEVISNYNLSLEDAKLYLGTYLVFPTSDVFKLTGHKMRGYQDRQGYIQMQCGGKPRRVHRIVAESFIEREPGKNIVNHIDGDKTNNSLSNLEWCTSGENNKHAYDMGLVHIRSGEENPSAKLNWDTVREIRKQYQTEIHNTYTLAEIYGVSQCTIWRTITNKNWQEKGV